MRLGIIGGTGAAALVPAGATRVPAQPTPWGEASAALWRWESSGHEFLFLSRHGEPAAIPPHAVNYRANVWQFRVAGVDHLVGINVVGGIAAAATPGRLVIPDQIIDYTHGRAHTYAGPGGLGLLHVEFTEPFCAVLRGRLLRAAERLRLDVLGTGTYGVTEGPRLETAAEIDRLERDGCAIVGMTAMPEAGLAREVGLSYATCCPVVNHAAGRAPAGAGIHAEMAASLAAGLGAAGRLLAALPDT